MAGALDVIRVVADMTLLGQTILNVWHMISPDSVPDSEVVEDAQELLETMYVMINGNVDSELTYDAIRIFNVTGNEDLGIHPWTGLTTGATAGEALPLGVAGLLTLPTSIPKVRGRKFFGGFVEAVCSNGLWVTGTTDTLEDVGEYVSTPQVSPSNVNTWVFGIPTLNNGFQAFQSYLVSNVPSYQRRRKQGVGS